MEPLEYRIFGEKLNLFPFQKLYFSRFVYGHFVPVFPEEATVIPAIDSMTPGTNILVVSGVANPKPFVRYLRRHKAKVKLKRFGDHHNFSASDLEEIARIFEQIPEGEKFIATTEKDAVRLFNNPYFPHSLKPYIFYVPIKVGFIDRGENEFILTLEKTIRDSRLFKS
ncbi:MAG: tetraacyldisaccharide 4'-kinase [Muribaculaceae bacterium]|nr:tetraacyldisaccharide 4'-kinase [Muribaculaceae bacterium]